MEESDRQRRRAAGYKFADEAQRKLRERPRKASCSSDRASFVTGPIIGGKGGKSDRGSLRTCVPQNEKPQHGVPGLGQPLAYIRRAIATVLNVAVKSEQLMTAAGPFGGEVDLRRGWLFHRLRRFRLEHELRFGEMFPALGLGKPFPALFRVLARLLAAQKRDRAAALGVFHPILPGCAICAIHG
jgi:hypothetical protein